MSEESSRTVDKGFNTGTNTGVAGVDDGGDEGPLCANCARPDADLAPVHRMYVVVAAWDTEGSEKVLDDVETWCFSCRTLYPHRALDGRT